jgi:hypothetical protein
VTKTPSRRVEVAVQPKRHGVRAVAEHCQPAGVFDDGVEHVTMDYQQPPAVGSNMDDLFRHFDATELQQSVVAQPLIMVARNVNNPRAFANFTQNLLDHIIVGLRPVP